MENNTEQEQSKPTVMDVQPPKPTVEEAPVDRVEETVTDTDTPEQAEPTPLVATHNPETHHKTPVGAITAALVVAVALAAVSVFAYNKQNKPSTTTPTASTNQTVPQKATAQDVDTVTKAVDDALNQIDDTQDFDSNSLSDTSLNL